MSLTVTIQHVVHLVVSGLLIAFQIDNLRNNTGTELTYSVLLTIAASLLAVIHLGLSYMSFNKSDSDDEDVENKPVKAFRHLAGTIALISAWYLLGDKNQGGHAEEKTEAVLSLILITSKRVLDVFLDMEKNIMDSLKVDCLEDRIMGYKTYLVAGQLALFASAVLAIMHQNKFDESGGSRSKLDSNGESANDWAFVLILIHAGLHPVVVIIDMLYSMVDPDKAALSVLMQACRRKDGCKAEEERVELVGFNRIPLVRQVVSSTILLLLAYVLGAVDKAHAGVREDGTLLALVLVYTLADAIGRNIV